MKLSCLSYLGIACEIETFKILIHALLILAESSTQTGEHKTEMEEVSIPIPTGLQIFCHPL